MIDRFLSTTLLVIVSIASSAAQTPSSSYKPIQSGHRQGPDGLEGWTVSHRVALDPEYPEAYPDVLVIARHGHVIRNISGEPFVWNWIFWAEGRQIAYETGPLHFGMLCTLADIATGNKLASYDCFHELPANAPEWERALQAAQ